MKTQMIRHRLGPGVAAGVALMIVMIPASAGIASGHRSGVRAQRAQVAHRKVVAGTVRVNVRARQPASQPRLTTVPSRILQSRGVALEVPRAAAAVSRQAALTKLLVGDLRGATVRETVLAQVRFRGQAERNTAPYWVVSLMPAGGTKMAADSVVKVSYMVAFVNAVNGQAPTYIMAVGNPAAAPSACCDVSTPAMQGRH